MHAVIVAHAPLLDAAPYQAQLAGADLLIAADGGALALLRVGLLPHVLVGDLDSIDDATLDHLRAASVEIQQFPRAKDATDLELALLLAIERGATALTILGALGGRWDHTLANVAMLTHPALVGRQVQLLADQQTLFLVRDHASIAGSFGDTISLLPLTATVQGVTTQGLLYPLDEATLYYEQARGVSNVLLQSPATVRLRTGLLLVVQHHDGGAHQWRSRPEARG